MTEKPPLEPQNQLHKFLLEQGIPATSLPKVIEVTNSYLTPIMEGHKKENKTEIFYVCVCNSGHNTCCGDFTWEYSGWSFRVKGKNVVFFNGDWVFDISQIPIFQDILFIVSKRTIFNEAAQSRSDVLCVTSSRKKLQRKIRRTETNRNRH